MKFETVAACRRTGAVLACVATVAAASFNARPVSLRAQSSARLSSIGGHSQSRALALVVDGNGDIDEEAAHFGDTRCPCIGFDNIEGETTVVFEDKEGDKIDEVAYPADLGARCEPWDDGKHHLCRAGGKPGKGKEWCAQPWCYVDPCDCAIPTLPKPSAYLGDAMYRGKPLFFSYATCGGKDMWTKGVPEVGTPGCRCIGFDNVPGTTEMLIDGKMVDFPAEVGGSCQAWDKNTHPLCKKEKPPKWCSQLWCYVDPCSCGLPEETPPKISQYLPEATFTGKGIYYSYETCGSKDHYTKDFHSEACVNQDNEKDCVSLERCGWTGEKCLGAELIDHPLCQEGPIDHSEGEDSKDDDDDEEGEKKHKKKKKSGAPAVSVSAALVTALVTFLRA